MLKLGERVEDVRESLRNEIARLENGSPAQLGDQRLVLVLKLDSLMQFEELLYRGNCGGTALQVALGWCFSRVGQGHLGRYEGRPPEDHPLRDR